MVPRKILFPAIGAAVSLILSLATLLFRMPEIWSIVITAALVLFVIFVMDKIVHVSYDFIDWPVSARNIVVRFISAAIIANGVIAITLEVAGITALPSALLCLLILVAVEFLLSWIVEMYLAQLRPRLVEAKRTRELEVERTMAELAKAAEPTRAFTPVEHDSMSTEEENRDLADMRRALEKIDLGWLKLYNPEHLTDGDGSPFGIRFNARIGAKSMAKKNHRSFGMEHAEPIAAAIRELTDIPMQTRWVQIRKEREAGVYTVTVTKLDIMARIWPHEEVLEWASIKDPCLIGYGMDAKPATLLLQQHGQFLGKTRNGKTSLINVTIAYGLRCRDAVYWICGVKKLYDILAAWLEVYLNTGVEMPFDWIMAGPQDTAEMLAALMRVAQYRETLPLDEREGLPDIVCILDEAYFALRDTSVKVLVNGQWCTMSEIAALGAQGNGSAGIWQHWATQRDTNEQLGNSGGNTQAQAGFSAMFGTQDNLSIGRQLGDFKLPAPHNKGEFYLKDDDGDDYPVLLRSTYIQENDPRRPRLHDGPTISQVSWNRRHFKTYLDEGSQKAAGEKYPMRYTLVTKEFLDYLRNPTKGQTVMPEESMSGDLPDESKETSDETSTESLIEKLAAKFGVNLDTASDVEKEALQKMAQDPQVAREFTKGEENPPFVGTAGANRTELIIHLLQESDEPLSSMEILTQLKGMGHAVKNDGAVYNLLGKLVKDGVLEKGDDRLFCLASD